jgi:hypothetical protein
MATKRLPRPRDPIALAKLIGDIATGQVVDITGNAPNRAKGGKKGGRARADSLTPEQRSKIASAAARARWKKGAY